MNTQIEKLSEGKQVEIKKLIEFALEPLRCGVIEFREPYKITNRSRQGDEPWREWVEYWFTVVIRIESGERWLGISSTHLNSSEDAAWVCCHNFCYSGKLTDEERQKVIERLYSKEFLEFSYGKK